MKKIILILLSCFNLLPLFSLHITGIDTSEALISGRIKGYFYDDKSSSNKGYTLEYRKNNSWVPTPIRIEDNTLIDKRDVSILYLIDNSGSMYDSLDGSSSFSKMDGIKAALSEDYFSSHLGGVEIGIASFNTFFNQGSPFSLNRMQLVKALNLIEEPSADRAYTELNWALKSAFDLIGKQRGRKIVVLLSDGENYSYLKHKSKAHPIWGTDEFSFKDLEDLAQKRGITLFTIFYDRLEDRDLQQLTDHSGGLSYKANKISSLKNVYNEIQQRVSEEVEFEFKAPLNMDKNYNIRIAEGNKKSNIFHFTWTLFWLFESPFPLALYLFCFIFSLIFMIWLFKRPYQSYYTYPYIEIFDPDNKFINKLEEGRTSFQYAQNRTLIGSKSDFTKIEPQDIENEYTIIAKDDGNYEIESEKPIMVNNNETKKRVLSDGDLIQIGETTIIFNKERIDKKN